ncbi:MULTISPECIES: protease modulator HflC [unclassified Butyrivibrio]|jgi:membrane protease subunit HflC|uniref:protease modulator HflC n=1 Tax=unclassified Butyrivibrio TaxID=2639466 RepID=UPI0003B7A2D6|nr:MULTISPECIES: protease modulator HflC [unclassified Butyrivibrio]
MKKKVTGTIITIIIIAALIILGNSLYTVHQKEYVAVRQFGKIVKVESQPGLNMITPFVQTTQRISAATKIYDIPASDVITKDKKSMITDTYVLWKVVDPVKYIQSLNALDARAQERIEAAVYNATKTAISSMTQDEVIESRGEVLTNLITADANSDMSGYGIEIVKAEIKALDLPDDNRAAVYERMISERNNIAASYQAEGAAEAQKIKNETDKKVAILKADAEKSAAKLAGEGEAEYMKTLSEAYNTPEKSEFYNYVRSLDAFKESLGNGEKTIILDKNSELARMFYMNH